MELETSKNTTNSAAARKRKGNGDQKASAADDAPLVAGKIFAQFITRDGDKTGPQCELPMNITTEQLELLLNNVLLKNEEPLPYSFYINDVEVLESLQKAIVDNKIDTEQALPIVYQPQAVFRVRSVTRCTASMEGHDAPVIAVQFSPDGTQLASGSGDSTVRLWDLNTGTPQAECKGHKQYIVCISWSPNGKLLASGGYDGLVMLWDPESGKAKGTLKGHKQWITALAWQPLHLDVDCTRIASSGKDGTIRIWDTRLCQCVQILSGHTMSVTCLRWSGENLIISGSQDRTLKVYAPDTGKLVRTLEGHGHWVNTLAMNTDFALRTGATDHNGVTPPAEDKAAIKEAARKRWEAVKGNRPERVVSGSDDFTMFLWEPSANKKALTRMTGHQQPINQVSFSPDGRYFASASFDKSVKIWDGYTGAFLGALRGHVGAVYQACWSADSRILVSGSKDSTIKAWNFRTKKMQHDLPGHADEVYSVDWSPDGTCVCSGGKDRVLKIWKY